ncbi:MAG TPA: UvrD-helicase domain-containing protein, partial [Thermoanaerobaculia bacterium]|nr:UvrD-helicase domain-containing protein [Thermoanaerobaculia bacterium]
ILGLDSRHLLEIALASGPDAYLIPAHIWTPWFAALGSKSGFDSIDECYGDLAPHIFAVETGLSSDPPMNWRVSQLDRFTLVSNSDAHSPPMLGREACAFDTDLDYFAIRRALETGEGYGGTVEFFPEEGKYHLDGHRACGVRLEPPETRRLEGRCPSCGKPLTVGVMHRVEELADRSEDAAPPRPVPFRSLVQLPEILGEIQGVGPKSRSVEAAASQLVGKLGPEIDILERLPLEDVERAGGGLLREALSRLREGRVRREAGYDGEYGVIRLFEPEEIRGRGLVGTLFANPTENFPGPGLVPAPPPGRSDRSVGSVGSNVNPVSEEAAPLDPEQQAAVEIVDGPLLIVAGPGTGKTRTLTHRIAHLITQRGARPEQCLAVTFSRRAAAEMEERLDALLPPGTGRPLVATFHGLGLAILTEQAEAAGLAPGFRVATPMERPEIVRGLFDLTTARAERLLEEMGKVRCGREAPSLELTGRIAAYESALTARDLLDFDDLLLRPLALLRERPDLAEAYR